jgi:acyl-ACP thioesterase
MTADDRAGVDAPAGAPAGTSFTAAFRVRFDEATPDGTVRTSALLRYAQDCAWLHSEALGFGREWYAARGLTWIVRALEVAVTATVGTGATIEAMTAVIGFRRVWARRRTALVDAGTGIAIARVDTDWVMTDTARGLPTRVPDEFPAMFGVPPGPFEPHRVALPPTPPAVATSPVSVRPHHLDPLGHANNAVYIDWLEDTVRRLDNGQLRLARTPRRYRLEYLLPARLDAALEGIAFALPGEAGAGFRLTGPDGELLRGRVDPV